VAFVPYSATDNRFLRLTADNLYAMGGGVVVPTTETDADYAYYVAKNLYAMVVLAGDTVGEDDPHLGEANNMLLRKIATASAALTT
jgi:hypothetical protein